MEVILLVVLIGGAVLLAGPADQPPPVVSVRIEEPRRAQESLWGYAVLLAVIAALLIGGLSLQP